jgi:NAD-specific glutamate dehydrogenase
MEVLCYLALNASEYEKMSKLKNGKPSKFMEKFMKDVVEKIQANASAEFEFIWKKSKDFSTYL